MVGVIHVHPLHRIRDADNSADVHVGAELVAQLESLERSGRLRQRHAPPARTGDVSIEARPELRQVVAIFRQVDDAGSLERRFVNKPAGLHDRDRRHRTVGTRVDLVDVAVFLPGARGKTLRRLPRT